jgi:carbon-monoxide dehydrogenase medium subunit
MKAWQAESALFGENIGDVDPQAIADLALSETEPLDDHSATADYRRSVGRQIFVRTLSDALNLRKAA